MKAAKSLAKSIMKELEKKAQSDGHLFFRITNHSSSIHLSPNEQLLYLAIRKDIENLCSVHNALWDTSSDAVNPEDAIITACKAIEDQVVLLNDRMNDLLENSFDNLSEKTIQAHNLSEKAAITLLSEQSDERAFLYETKRKAKKSA